MTAKLSDGFIRIICLSFKSIMPLLHADGEPPAFFGTACTAFSRICRWRASGAKGLPLTAGCHQAAQEPLVIGHIARIHHVQQYHDRMPLVLEESQFEDCMRGPPEVGTGMMKSYSGAIDN